MNKDKADNNVDVTIDNKGAITSNLNQNNNGNQISSKTGNHSEDAATMNISPELKTTTIFPNTDNNTAMLLLQHHYSQPFLHLPIQLLNIKLSPLKTLTLMRRAICFVYWGLSGPKSR